MPNKETNYGPTMSLAEVRDALGIRPRDLERLFQDRGHPIIEDAMGVPAVDQEHAAALIREVQSNRLRRNAARRAYEDHLAEQAKAARLERLAQAREAFENAREKSKKLDAAWAREQARRREAKAEELEARRRADWEAAGRPKPWTEFFKEFKWSRPGE